MGKFREWLNEPNPEGVRPLDAIFVPLFTIGVAVTFMLASRFLWRW